LNLPVTGIDTPRILEEMSEASNSEFDLDQLSEAETDEEFGLPEFREHFADALTPAVLKDWTAGDFSSIYVRFRPHLERHARRFLTNAAQVDDVVQDAFLYLMTSLPDLDSELGVLRYLKWKVRLLCLDTIRANGRTAAASIEEAFDLESSEPEVSSHLERVDEAAVVSMALARINPRHREAIIATLYEEKTPEAVANQLGLSENAFRQLLFRARAAFKKSLVGEASTAGLTASEILSVAARKAARDAGRGVLPILALIALVAGAAASLPNESMLGSPEQTIVGTQESSDFGMVLPNDELEIAREPNDQFGSLEESTLPNLPAATAGEILPNGDIDLSEESAENVVAQQDLINSGKDSLESGSVLSIEEIPVVLDLFQTAVSFLNVEDITSDLRDGQLEIVPSSGNTALVSLESASNRLHVGLEDNLSFVRFLFIENTESEIVLAPTSISLLEEQLGNGNRRIFIVGTDFLAGDLSGQITSATAENSSWFGAYFQLQLDLDNNDDLVGGNVSISKGSQS